MMYDPDDSNDVYGDFHRNDVILSEMQVTSSKDDENTTTNNRVIQSPRLVSWFMFFLISIITLGSSIEASNADSDHIELRHNHGWVVACSSISFIITVSVVTMQSSPRFAVMVVDTKLEGILILSLLAFWMAAVALISDAENGLAVNGEGVVVYGNLYYFSWGGMLCSVFLFISFLRSIYFIDVIGEYNARAPRLMLWSAFLVSTIIVMGSGASIFDINCNVLNPDRKFCRRTRLAVAIGIIGTLCAILMVGMKIAVRYAPFYLEFALSAILFITYAFATAYITSERGPGAPLGNLYYSVWASFIEAFFICVGCFEAYQLMDGEGQLSYEERIRREVEAEALSELGYKGNDLMDDVEPLFKDYEDDDYEDDDFDAKSVRSEAKSVRSAVSRSIPLSDDEEDFVPLSEGMENGQDMDDARSVYSEARSVMSKSRSIPLDDDSEEEEDEEEEEIYGNMNASELRNQDPRPFRQSSTAAYVEEDPPPGYHDMRFQSAQSIPTGYNNMSQNIQTQPPLSGYDNMQSLDSAQPKPIDYNNMNQNIQQLSESPSTEDIDSQQLSNPHEMVQSFSHLSRENFMKSERSIDTRSSYPSVSFDSDKESDIEIGQDPSTTTLQPTKPLENAIEEQSQESMDSQPEISLDAQPERLLLKNSNMQSDRSLNQGLEQSSSNSNMQFEDLSLEEGPHPTLQVNNDNQSHLTLPANDETQPENSLSTQSFPSSLTNNDVQTEPTVHSQSVQSLTRNDDMQSESSLDAPPERFLLKNNNSQSNRSLGASSINSSASNNNMQLDSGARNSSLRSDRSLDAPPERFLLKNNNSQSNRSLGKNNMQLDSGARNSNMRSERSLDAPPERFLLKNNSMRSNRALGNNSMQLDSGTRDSSMRSDRALNSQQTRPTLAANDRMLSEMSIDTGFYRGSDRSMGSQSGRMLARNNSRSQRSFNARSHPALPPNNDVQQEHALANPSLSRNNSIRSQRNLNAQSYPALQDDDQSMRSRSGRSLSRNESIRSMRSFNNSALAYPEPDDSDLRSVRTEAMSIATSRSIPLNSSGSESDDDESEDENALTQYSNGWE